MPHEGQNGDDDDEEEEEDDEETPDDSKTDTKTLFTSAKGKTLVCKHTCDRQYRLHGLFESFNMIKGIQTYEYSPAPDQSAHSRSLKVILSSIF